MSDYQNISFRMVDIGLNLREDPDKVSEGQWTRLKNLKPQYEGSLATRSGRTLLIDTTSNNEVHTIKRIGTTTLLVGAGTGVYRTNTLVQDGFSGSPLTIALVKPNVNSTSKMWAYVGDGEQLRKVSEEGKSYKWGITAPTHAAAFTAVGTTGQGSLDSSVAGAIVYDWRYTYFSSETGAQSNPSPITTGVAVAGQQARINVQASDDPQVDTIKIWRRGGTIKGGWLFVGSTGNADTSFTDNNSDSAITNAEQLLEDNYVPFSTIDQVGNGLEETPLPYVWGPFIGKYILASGDPNRPGYLYWTNNERPDSASPTNNLSVTSPIEPLQAGFIFDGLPYVWSRENLYAIDFGGPNAIPTFTTRKTSVGKGVCAPYAFCTGPAIWFVSQDGIYQTNGQNSAEPISEKYLRPLFQGLTTGGVAPIDFEEPNYIRLFYADNELHFFYKDTNGVVVHLILALYYDRWRQEEAASWSELVAYQDENQVDRDVLIGASNGKLYEVTGTDDDGTAITWNVRTGSLDFGMPQTYKELGNVILDANPQGNTITITPYTDAETGSLTPITSNVSGRQKITGSLSDNFVYSVGFDFSGSGPTSLYQFDILFRPDEEAILHWEFPPTSHTLSGWQQVRDLYMTVRSTSDLTLKVYVDGVLHTYTSKPDGTPWLPSTGGEKLKQHVWLNPTKGKVFRYVLEGSSPFRLYGADCEVRVKPWNTALGYTLVSPFREEGSFKGSRGPDPV